MKISNIKTLIVALGFQHENLTTFIKRYKQHKNYAIRLDFEHGKIDYGKEIDTGDNTTTNFSQDENFVVLECVNRLLEKGYKPQHLMLERKWQLGHSAKGGKADISIFDHDSNSLIIIECKTHGKEFEKEQQRMLNDGGQLFSYLQQDKNTRFLCLYSSALIEGQVIYQNRIIRMIDRPETLKLVDEADENQQRHDLKTYRDAKTKDDFHAAWLENFNGYFAPNGIFDADVQAYNPELLPIKQKDLKPFDYDEGRKFFNQFEEILRHNNISDKSNAFNRIISLILCKIVDEQKGYDTITDFQIIEGKDTPELIQERLQNLFAQGMQDYLKEDIVNFTSSEIDHVLNRFPEQEAQNRIREMFRQLKFYSNNEFAFKEVHNEKLFLENAKVLNEIITLLQGKRFRYDFTKDNGNQAQKQYLGNFFELLLDAGYKQSEGQFFTPIPIARFMVNSLPLRHMVMEKLAQGKISFLPFVMDYACGSGHFLTEMIEALQKIIRSLTPDYKSEVNEKIDLYQQIDWTHEYIYGVEKDYRLARTAKVACFMNGDGQANIIFGDGLESHDNLAKSYDIVIANPPYSIHGFKPHIRNLAKKFDVFKHLTDNSSEIEVMFVERTAQLLHDGGMAAIFLPSSILSNTGIYTKARQVIMQNFHIKAIVEFGSATFMATGTNTIVLFMQKREYWDKPNYRFVSRDFILRNIPRHLDFADTETMYKNYVAHIGLNFEDYQTFVARKANKAMRATDWYKMYRTWFDDLTATKQLKQSRKFKAWDETKQEKELNHHFYNQVLQVEHEKFYYYLLAQEQKTLIIKSGNSMKKQRQFLGYKFKGGRQAGMVMFRDAKGNHRTMLHDESDFDNPEKINTLIKHAFLGADADIPEALQKHVKEVDLLDCFDFGRTYFETQISLSPHAKAKKIESQWEIVRIGDICKTSSGGTPLSTVTEYYENGDIPWINSGEVWHGVITKAEKFITQLGMENSSAKLFPVDTVLVAMYGATVGQVGMLAIEATTNQAICGILPNNAINPNYLFFYLRERKRRFLALRTGVARLNISQKIVRGFKIPLPPMQVQVQIVQDMQALETKEATCMEAIESAREAIVKIANDLYERHDKIALGELCEHPQYGANEKAIPGNPETDYRYIRITDIDEHGRLLHDWHTAEHVDEKYILQHGDFLFARSGSVGKTFLYLQGMPKAIYAGYLIRFKPIQNKLMPEFLNLVTKSGSYQTWVKNIQSQVTIPNINAKQYASLLIPNLHFSEQERLMEEVESHEKLIAEKEARMFEIQREKIDVLSKYL